MPSAAESTGKWAARAKASARPAVRPTSSAPIQLEQNKQIREQRSKAERQATADYKRQLKLQKAKARHRGGKRLKNNRAPVVGPRVGGSCGGSPARWL